MTQIPAHTSELLVLNEKLLAERRYWLDRLATLPAPAHPPYAYTQPATVEPRWAEAELNLDGAVYQQLTRLAAQGPFLLYTTLLTALKVCLHRYTGQPTIAVGSPARRAAEDQPANALVIVDQLRPEQSFRELLLSVRATLLEAYARQHYPFQRLLHDLELDRAGQSCPLFDVAILLTEIHGELPAVGNNLTLAFTRADDQLRGRIRYNAERFSAEAIAHVADQLRCLLEHALSDTSRPIDELELVSPEQRAQLLAWSHTSPAAAPHDVMQLFALQAARTPDAIALVCEDVALRYAELDARANQLAHFLRQQGVGRPGQAEWRVALLLERSPELIVALLAVLKAGGAYVPLDPSYPAERLQFMIDDAQVALLLTQSALLRPEGTRRPLQAPQLVCLDQQQPVISAQPTAALAQSWPAEQLAYIIYTSGSTGQPKGVLVPRAGLANLAHAQISAFGVERSSRVLQFAPISFDASVSEILMALLAGACLCLAPADAIGPGAALAELLRRLAITTVTLPPSVLTTVPPGGLPALKTLIVAGEACPASLVAAWSPEVRLINAYGPTEATVCATLGRCDEPRRDPPIGRPIANVTIYLLDERLRPVAVGVPGELYIGGIGLARGYQGQPALTAARFIPDPFSGAEGSPPGARLYRSGDLARYLPDGTLDYLGRVDQQIKLRGFRIEPDEIAAVLQQHPAVQAATVVLRQHARGQAQLVAYVVPAAPGAAARAASQQPVAAAELRTFLQQRLPDYMLPGAFVLLAALPLTPNGKLDRAALPAPDRGRPSLTQDFVAPRTPDEQTLAQLCGEVLGVDQVGIYDNFFELGGHSLLATQILSRVREVCQVEVPLRSFFKAPTVAELAEIVGRLRLREQRPAGPEIVPVPRDQELPLSFAQQRLWFLDQLSPGNSAYNVPAALRLRGQLDVAALSRSLDEIVRRHEALRTTFALGTSGPVQLIAPTSPVTLQQIDQQALSPAEQEAAIMRLAQQEIEQPFDLARGPLLRATLLRLHPEGSRSEHVLLFTMHHIVSDGWSIGVLVRELAALYPAFAAGQPSPLPALPVQYADFAVWQRQLLAPGASGGALATQLAYWRKQLSGAPPLLRLPTDHPRPATQSYRGSFLSQTLPLPLSGALQALSQQEESTLFMTLLAAFLSLLQRASGQHDLVVGTDVANRNRVEVEPLIGFFVNLLALRVDLGGNPTFRELLRRVRDVALGAYGHQDLPFEKLVDELQLPRTLNYTPLCQVLFVHQNAPIPPLDLPGLTISPLELAPPVAKFDLLVTVHEREQGLLISWNYSTDLFEPTTIERMARHFEARVTQIVAQPDVRLDRLDLLVADERIVASMDTPERKESRRKGFMNVKPKAVNLPRASLVTTRTLAPDQPLPLIVEPAVDDVDLVEWAQANRAQIDQDLLKHGAILFHGFAIPSVPDFERVALAVTDQLFGEYGDLPREGVGGNVYTSTPYPADKAILFHNESSHLHRWPMKQWFYCVKAAQQGGDTPLADCRRVYQELRPATRERFARAQLMYVRNFTEGLDVPWQEFFGTQDRAAVEAFCRANGIMCEWHGQNGLRTRQIRQAVAQHPRTGEWLFFNQLQVHHIACLDQAAQDSLRALYAEEDLPRNVYYGDGTPIEDEVIQEILDVYQRVEVRFRWSEGDVVLLDNMLTAHGRSPFVGPRKIVVAMGDMISAADLAVQDA